MGNMLFAAPVESWVFGSLRGKMTAYAFAPVRLACFADAMCRR
jgi:hypothetical protein